MARNKRNKKCMAARLSQRDNSANSATQTNNTSHTQPERNLLQRLPPELRDRIFEFFYSDNKTMVIVRDNKFFGKPDAESWNVFHGYRILRPDIPLNPTITYGKGGVRVYKKKPPLEFSPLTSLLLVDKQTYLEAVPHLYGSCTFHFDQPPATQLFAKCVGRANLKYIRKAEVYILATTVRDCDLIVKHMPNIEQLTVRLPYHTIWVDDFSRNRKFEEQLQGFSALKKIVRLGVEYPRMRVRKIFSRFEGGEELMISSDVTTEALKEMIRTGDCLALSRARRANPESRSRWV